MLFAVREFDRQREQDRLGSRPYLRVDLAFEEQIARERNLAVPTDIRIYSPEELGVERQLAAFRDRVAPVDNEPTFRLVLWLRNLQAAPLAIADGITIIIAASVPGATGPNADSVETMTSEVEVAYLAPLQITAIELARVRRDIRFLSVSSDSVRYRDIFARAEIVDAHGALTMRLVDGAVRNERAILRPYDIRVQGQRSPDQGPRGDSRRGGTPARGDEAS